jgi:flagellar basal body rod protein FlgG
MYKTNVKEVLIDVSDNATISSGVNTDGMLLTGLVFPAAMTGTEVTFDFSIDGTNWYDVVETDGTAVTYTVTAGDAVRVDPSGWAFASSGFIRVTSGSTETADRSIKLIFRTA